jgi:hypothetical protein
VPSGPCAEVRTPEALLVPPRVGRHVRFDGRWLHGAPAALRPPRPTDATEGYERITFCCNIWINHRPGNARRFTLPPALLPGGEAAEAPRLRHTRARGLPTSREAARRPLRARAHAGGEQHRFELSQTDAPHALRLDCPAALPMLLCEGHVVTLVDGVTIERVEGGVDASAPADCAATTVDEPQARPRKEKRRRER